MGSKENKDMVFKVTEKLRVLGRKYKTLILYVFFGGLTTLINIVVYTAAYDYVGISNVESNILAWIISVVFAYITNKIWVFESKSAKLKVLFYEIAAFAGCRVATGVLDLAIMYVAVDVLILNSMIMKCVSNVVVIVANYVASKLVIFKKRQ